MGKGFFCKFYICNGEQMRGVARAFNSISNVLFWFFKKNFTTSHCFISTLSVRKVLITRFSLLTSGKFRVFSTVRSHRFSVTPHQTKLCFSRLNCLSQCVLYGLFLFLRVLVLNLLFPQDKFLCFNSQARLTYC